MIAGIDVEAAVFIMIGLFLGGLVKGATGAGTPVVAVPVIAAFVDIKLAVAIMVIPNLMTNVWQQWAFRKYHLSGGFALKLALAGGLGALVGTVLLTSLKSATLSLVLVCAIVLYIGLRLARPDFRLELVRAQKLVVAAGIGGGILQGMAGISAPVAVSFLNAMRLERVQFIATISAFFITMSLVQIPALFAYGLLTPGVMLMSAVAMAPLFVSMPLGSWAARKMSATAFDRALLILLSALALRLGYSAVIDFVHP